MDPITSLPAPDDMDADYSPQYVKLARILRDKIKTGQLNHPTALRGTVVAAKYGVSAQVAHAALEMLAANRYITRPPGTRYYHVGPQATANDRRARG